MALLYPFMQLGLFADVLGLSFDTCRRVHGAAAWMTSALLALHIVVAMLDHQKFSLHEQSNLFAVIGAGSLVGLMLFSLSLFRRLSFELFLRTHQALAAVCIYMTWRHLPSVSIFPRVYIYIPLAILLLSTFLHVLLFLYRNGILPPRTYPYASVMCRKKCENTQGSDEDPAEDTPLKIRMALPRPMHVKAGQYVNLWMPSVSFSSWLQCHPFMVTSWSPGRQDVLDLFVRTRHGLTEKLRARAAREGTASFTAFVSGPYGRSESVGEYESVLAVASGFGIAGVVPYIKRLLYGYNTSSVRVRRVHLVWQVQTMDIAVAAEPLLNSLLDDDVLDDGYILEMSFYAEYKTKAGKARPFGVHHRATIYNGFPDYDSIISTEATGEHIERVSNSREERVSAKDELQDHLTVIVRKYLDQRVKFHKVEFQPS
ncbi:hypothetical protein KXW70_006590 [Aspergillus fumigatus]|nr:hypothetical protein KXW92_002919 [Aspergillus fumigatus]KAH2485927.1 hypothetical protein KXW70_006590 [Aspergillus fumigatus]